MEKLPLETASPNLVTRLQEARARIKPCSPPPWLRGGHRQTLLAHLLPSAGQPITGETLNVTLEGPDERIVTTFVRGTRPVAVYLFHGLGGSSEAAYMRRTARIASDLGCAVFLNNHRGCGVGAGLASEPYHSGRAEDLSAVIAFGRKRLPHHLHIAIGFSLSANALLLLAAGIRASILPDVAIAVNGPIELDHASLKLREGMNRIYDWNYVRELKSHLRKIPTGAHLPSQQVLRNVRTLRDLDELYTAPAGGFADRAEYYRVCSAR